MDTTIDFKIYRIWIKLSINKRLKFLSENHFWDGFSHYLYEYLPEDVKEKLSFKTA